MLLHSPRADVQLFRDFLVAAPLNQQVKNLLISAGNLDSGTVHHSFSSVSAVLQAPSLRRLQEAKAGNSPNLRQRTRMVKDLRFHSFICAGSLEGTLQRAR